MPRRPHDEATRTGEEHDEHLVGVCEELLRESELPGGEIYTQLAHLGASRFQVEAERTASKWHGAALGRISQPNPDPRQEFFEFEWLREKVVCSAVETQHRVVHRMVGGEHNHRGGRVCQSKAA